MSNLKKKGEASGGVPCQTFVGFIDDLWHAGVGKPFDPKPSMVADFSLKGVFVRRENTFIG